MLGWFAFLAICGFCHKDFKSLGGHQWRCRKKLNDQQEDTGQRTYSSDSSSIQLDHGNNVIEETNERLLSSNSEISCVGGKVCKGNRSHQPACRTIRGLNQELTNALRSYDHDNEDEITTDNLVQLDDQVRTKPGIKLPKTDSGWELANLFFKSELSTSNIDRDNLNETIASMNSTIYDYFAENYGTVETDNKKDNDLLEKYGEFSVNNLKKELKKLKKRSNSDLRTIKFVSKSIRSKLKNNSEEPVNKHKDAIYAADHDAFIKHSGVWKYAYEYF